MSLTPSMLASRLLVVLSAALFATVSFGQDLPRDEAGFTEHVANLLRKEVGEEAVTVKSPLTLALGQLQANLDRVFVFCRNNAAACPQELDRYVKGAAQVLKERNAPPSKDAVRVVIRTVQYARAAQASISPQPEKPVQIQPRPFVEGLVALPALDTPRAIRMLGDKDNAQLGLSEQELYELGLANLRKELKPLMEVAKVAGPKQIGHLSGDSFHPSRLLLLDTWAPLAKEQGGILIVAIPATDAVFYIGEDSPVAIDALRGLVKEMMARAPNRLSNILLRWRETGWEPVP